MRRTVLEVTKAVVTPTAVYFDPDSGLVDCGPMVDFKAPPCCEETGPKKHVHVWMLPPAPLTWVSECKHCASTWTYVEKKR